MRSLPTPSSKTAAVAGLWSAAGLGLTELWSAGRSASSVAEHNFIWLVASVVFFFLPVFLFVLGVNRPLAWNWFTQAEERVRYGTVVTRMLVWFVTAGAALAALAFLTQ